MNTNTGTIARTEERRRIVVLAVSILLGSCSLENPGVELIEAGRKIYEQGILPSGRPLQGKRLGGDEISGQDAACAQCHQRSGMGLAEGSILIPPITEPVLFRNDWPARDVPERPPGIGFKDYAFRARVPYTDQSLALAIREGVLPNGKDLGYMMPRYGLTDADLRALSAYLHSLSAVPSPGADASTAHFATVVAPGVDSGRRAAFLGVLDSCFREHFPEIESPESKGRQMWHLDVWELQGPPNTWERQLATYFTRQPVFAMVSGLGNAEWTPVDRFCEDHRLPCLFPNVDVPGRTADGNYSFYFFKGALLEAEVLARHIQDHAGSLGIARVVQVSRSEGAGFQAAQTLRASLAGTPLKIEDYSFEPDAGQVTASLLSDIGKTDVLVLLNRPGNSGGCLL